MTWWQYLILANLYLALFYGFYALILRKETFFQLNRLYLVASAVLSFVMPVIQAGWAQNLFITQQVKMVIYNSPVILYQLTPVEESTSVGDILAYIYLAGIILLAGKLTMQFISLKKLACTDDSTTAYSFFKTIRVSRQLDKNDIIAAHEEVHARQWHSADVLLIELICILCWFNPVVYLYRKAIKHIHEFIADSQVVGKGADKAEYAMLLLSHSLNAPAHQLVNPFFNHSLLKHRIIMLQKNRSARVKLLKYGLSAPLFALMIIVSSATANNINAVQSIALKTTAALETPITEVRIIPPSPPAPSGLTTVPTDTENITKKTGATDTVPKKDSPIFTRVDEIPQFPGGVEAFSKYIGTYLRYPAKARDNNVTGKVFIKFIVEQDGSLSNITLLRGIGSGCDEEAMRVVRNSPKWIPGKQNGKKVRVEFAIPILFDIEYDEKNTSKYNVLHPVSVIAFNTEKEDKVAAVNSSAPAESNVVVVKGHGIEKKDPTNEVAVVGHKLQDDNIVINADTSKSLLYFRGGGAFNNPLIVLDDQEISQSVMNVLNPNKIQSISVYKHTDAIKRYGQKAANGVIVITTKKDNK